MPLWGLSKLVSLGLTGLSSTGIGIYFSPLLLEEQNSSPGQLYDLKGDLYDISTFLEREESLSKKLKELYSKFKLAVEDVIGKKGIKLSEIQGPFQKVSEEEVKLEKEYENSKKLVEELGRILKSHFETNRKKLEAEAARASFHNYNKLMTQTNSFMHEWGTQLKKFICAIDSGGEALDCETQAKDWLKRWKNGQRTTSIAMPSSSGGGTDSSKAALEQLDSSKKILETKLNKLGNTLNASLIQQIKATLFEALSEQEKKKYEDKLTFLSKWAEDWNNRLTESVQVSQETTSQLNEYYSKLEDNYQKWERLKENELVLYRYKSNIQNLLCSLKPSKNSAECNKEVA